MTPSRAGLYAAVHGFVGTAAGAFGAHALRPTLAPERLTVFETGARYELVAALTLLGLAAWLASGVRTGLAAAVNLMALGGVLFAGSLYALALTGMRGFGAVTPFGGACMLLAWVMVARAALKRG